jgi:hypothetical protein
MKRRLAIQTRKDRVITGYQVAPTGAASEGFTAVVEVDDSELIIAPGVPLSFRYVDGKVQRRPEKEIRAEARRQKFPRTSAPVKYLPSGEELSTDLLTEISTKDQKARELVAVAVLLAAGINLFASSLYALIQPMVSPVVIGVASLVLILCVSARYFAREYRRQLCVFRVSTAIVLNRQSGEVALPLVLSSKEAAFDYHEPFVVTVRGILPQLAKFNILKEAPFRIHETATLVCLLKHLHVRLFMSPPNTIGDPVEVGPIMGMAAIKTLPQRIQYLETACQDSRDGLVLSEVLPDVEHIILPAGMALSASFLQKDKPAELRFTTAALELRISAALGGGGTLEFSTWNRTFNMPKNELFYSALVLDLSVGYGGLLNTLSSRFQTRGVWTFDDYAVWFSQVVSWFADYLFWLHEEKDIPLAMRAQFRGDPDCIYSK